MKKTFALAFTLGAVVTLGAVTLYNRIKDELELGLNMYPEDFNDPVTIKKEHCSDPSCESLTCYGCHEYDCNHS